MEELWAQFAALQAATRHYAPPPPQPKSMREQLAEELGYDYYGVETGIPSHYHPNPQGSYSDASMGYAPVARHMSIGELLAADGIYVQGHHPQQQQYQEMLPAETLPPLEPVKAIVMEPPPLSHERAEATKATELELSEAIPVPILSPPSKDMSGRSEENQWPTEQCHVQVLTPHTTLMEQDNQVDTSSTNIEQVVHEIELLSGVEKAQVLGRRQERKAAMRKKSEGGKSGPRGRYKVRHALMKESRETSRRIKTSTPRNTTKVKMKAKRGVRNVMAPWFEGVSLGRCVPKMEYLKFVGGKHLFPPPFIP